MISLGQASNYKRSEALRHFRSFGTEKDFDNLRAALAKRYNAKVENVALYHSGRTALAVALETVLPPGKPVIIPGLTCIAVVRAVRAAGMKPVYSDISRDNLQYDYGKLEETLRELEKEAKGSANRGAKGADAVLDDPKAGSPIDKNGKVCYNGIIVVQNTLGITLNVAKIEKLAKKYNFAIVEDLAHAAGRFYPDGREVGTVGVATMLSFGKGKAIDTVTGGAVIIPGVKVAQPTKKPKLRERINDRWYPVLARMSRVTWRSGIGKARMALYTKQGWVERSADTRLDRETRLTYWQAKLALRQLTHLKKTPLREFDLVPDREKLLEKLDVAGYNFHDIWYDSPVAPARYAAEADFPEKKCPETVRVAKEIINIPTWYPEEKLMKAREIIREHKEAND